MEQRMGNRDPDRNQHALRRHHAASHGYGSAPIACETGLTDPAAVLLHNMGLARSLPSGPLPLIPGALGLLVHALQFPTGCFPHRASNSPSPLSSPRNPRQSLRESYAVPASGPTG